MRSTTLTQLPPAREKDNPAAWAYLALDPHLSLSYQYSLAVRSLQGLPSQQDYAYEYGGFAGTYREASLPLGQQALQSIEGLAWPGKTRIALGYQDWKQADFWPQARAYRILHLSVHGSLNWVDPMQSALHFSAEDSRIPLTVHTGE
jgi:CHAT domain-containing protein